MHKKKAEKKTVIKAKGTYSVTAPTVQDIYQDIGAIHKRSRHVVLARPVCRKVAVRITPKTPRLRK